ncbi:hypothetical protein K0B57_22695 [Salmonella enterica subsp. enterica serovar Montevideo]|nr:hypothetical protein [Salmonella enterica subsp. enterica serovar Montevideo]
MTTITIQMPTEWDFILANQLRNSMRRDWEDSLFMAKRQKLDEVYFADRIDRTADILLQVMAQIPE